MDQRVLNEHIKELTNLIFEESSKTTYFMGDSQYRIDSLIELIVDYMRNNKLAEKVDYTEVKGGVQLFLMYLFNGEKGEKH